MTFFILQHCSDKAYWFLFLLVSGSFKVIKKKIFFPKIIEMILFTMSCVRKGRHHHISSIPTRLSVIKRERWWEYWRRCRNIVIIS
jgi:hypothetical protein